MHIEKSLEWGLKAHEFFSSFMHQKGIITDKELRKIEREIEELNFFRLSIAGRYRRVKLRKRQKKLSGKPVKSSILRV